MGEVLKQVNEYTRFVSMLDEGYHMWDYMRDIAKPDGDCYPPTLIFGSEYHASEFGQFPLTEAWLKQIDTGDLELFARHIRIVLGLGAGDVVVETVRDNNHGSATMVVVATPEWREMTGYREDLKLSDYREIKCWWEDDFDVAVLERLETTVTVKMDGSTSQDEEWIEDTDLYGVVYPTYGFGSEKDAYLECGDVERLPVRYVANYSTSVEGQSVESVLEALRTRVKSDLVIR